MWKVILILSDDKKKRDAFELRYYITKSNPTAHLCSGLSASPEIKSLRVSILWQTASPAALVTRRELPSPQAGSCFPKGAPANAPDLPGRCRTASARGALRHPPTHGRHRRVTAVDRALAARRDSPAPRNPDLTGPRGDTAAKSPASCTPTVRGRRSAGLKPPVPDRAATCRGASRPCPAHRRMLSA